MICILKLDEQQQAGPAAITGWIIATDIHDARRQAQAAFDSDLAQALYAREFDPKPGKYTLPTGHVALVS